ncbi:hypothetical protein Ahy_B08g089889 [Arachis hypogaea]|uniref:Uncharacterized protein n=1 Tax=Arachis hypogaea TaxID=3818 RepID=A0A444XZ30_ARAHY|nr:hypothetical protein Ahy_B08g089889 [Arachis hypogaea]
MKFSIQCERTRTPIFIELFHGFREFLCYAIPSFLPLESDLIIYTHACARTLINLNLFLLCLMINAVLNGGHLSCSLCFLGFYQIQNLKLQFCPYGK